MAIRSRCARAAASWPDRDAFNTKIHVEQIAATIMLKIATAIMISTSVKPLRRNLWFMIRNLIVLFRDLSLLHLNWWLAKEAPKAKSLNESLFGQCFAV